MTDSPSWRAWADRAHRDSLKKPKASRNPRFRCTSCSGRTTKNQAKGSGGYCIYCRSPLRAFEQFSKEKRV